MAGEYGRYHNLLRADVGFIAPGQMRGCTYNAPSQHMWLHTLGIWAGRETSLSTNNVTARIGVYATDASRNPASRMGYSAAVTVTAAMINAATGAPYEAAVAQVDVAAPAGASFPAIPLWAGVRYHLAVLGTGGYLAHAMAEAADISMDNERFYNRTGLGQPPPNPFGSYSASIEGHATIWGNAEVNVAPTTPNFRAPLGTINVTDPTFEARFNDANEDRGDYLNQYRIQLRRVSDGLMMWDATYTASSAERAAGEMGRAYGGSALTRGTAYEWRVQMSDHFGAWSPWSSWLAFTPANLGFITMDGDPTGKIETVTPDFDGKWTHQSAEDMTHVKVRILNAAGTTVLQTSGEIDVTDVASSASPGTAFTVSWADTGLSALAWGTGYQAQLQGKDASGLWSDWSNARTFATNAAPGVPTGLAPGNSLPISTYPLLTCTATDADDTPGTGLVVKARIKDSGGSVLGTYDMTLAGAKWELQTTSTHLPSFATYRWDAYSYDGTLYSGEQTVEASAVKSAEATFVFAEGPVVTVSVPTDEGTVTTSSLLVEWSTTDQQKYRVTLYGDNGGAVVYDSGILTGADDSHLIPSGYLRNDTAYDLVVWVENSAPLEGQSQVIDFVVDYPEPDPVANVVAEAVPIGTDVWPSAIRITWDQTAYGTDVWQETTITRQAASGPDASPLVIARLTSPSQVSWTDYAPASGIAYTYAITQTIMTGVDILTSAPVVVTAQVDLGGVVLVNVEDPSGLRTCLRHTSERAYPREIDEAVYHPSDGGKPTTVRRPGRTIMPRFDVQLVDDRAATAATRRDELDAIDEAGGTYLYRDNHGRKLYVTIPEIEISDRVPGWYVAAIELREERFEESQV